MRARRPRSDATVALGSGRVLHVTEAAVLVQRPNGSDLWVPRSALAPGTYAPGTTVRVEVRAWWARARGLVDARDVR